MHAASPTPLEQRQWRKDAQRTVRLALVGVRDACKRFNDANTIGYKEATELGNNLLLQQYLRNMQLGVLRGVPNVRDAAAEKLLIQHCKISEQLHRSLRLLDGAVQSMRGALKDVVAKKDGESWQKTMPVFSTLTIGQIYNILQDLLAMYIAELAVKKSLVHAFDTAPAKLNMAKQDDCKNLVTLYLTTWLSNAHIKEDVAEQKLGILAEDMAGF